MHFFGSAQCDCPDLQFNVVRLVKNPAAQNIIFSVMNATYGSGLDILEKAMAPVSRIFLVFCFNYNLYTNIYIHIREQSKVWKLMTLSWTLPTLA